MQRPLQRNCVPVLVGLSLVLLFVLACAKTEEAAAPSPTPAAAPASSTPAVTPAPAAPSPAPATAPLVPAVTGQTAAPLTAPVAGTIQLDPRSQEPLSKYPAEFVRNHYTKRLMWEKAKYGGERLGTSVFSTSSAGNPFRFVVLGRPNYLAGMLQYDSGICSLLDRTDYSRCPGQRVNAMNPAVVPWVIERWERPAPLTVTLRVRQGVLWPAIPPMNRQDRSVTAEDIKWYMETQKKEGVERYTFELVDRIEVRDRFTLEITFTSPHADFIRMLAAPSLGLVPRECYEEKNCLTSKIISPGPYLVDTIVPRERSVLVKNEEFFLKGLPYIDRMSAINIADPASQKAAFITGKVDYWIANFPSERDAVDKQVPGLQHQTGFSWGGSWNFQPRADRPPFNDARVRQAISMAINRPEIWTVAYEGASMTSVPVPLAYLGLELPPRLSELGPTHQYNPEGAKKLLAEAGYPNGFTVTLWNSSSTYGAYEVITAVQDQLKRVGIILEPKTIDGTSRSNMKNARNWEGFQYEIGWGYPGMDLDFAFLQVYSKSPQNLMGINDPKIDDLYLKAKGELDPVKRQAMAWEYVRYMMDQAYAIHVANPVSFNIYQPWLANIAHFVAAGSQVYNIGGWPGWIDPAKMPK